MPVFDDHGCLFIHIPKNAGRSLEQALLGEKGEPDAGRRPWLNRLATFAARKSSSGFARQFLIGTLDYPLSSQHLTYAEIQSLGLVDEAKLKSYLKFCVVRNPFDRVVSSVRYFARFLLREGETLEPLDQKRFETLLARWFDFDFADHNLRAHRRPQWEYVVDMRGRPAMDEVLRFENLAEQFSDLARRLNLGSGHLPAIGRAPHRVDYREVFTSGARARVEREFGEDLEHFSYSF